MLQQFHATTIKLGFESHLLVQNSLISIYGKCGEMTTAQTIFYLMDKRDVVTSDMELNDSWIRAQ